MEVMRARRIRSGEEYTPLFPIPNAEDITIQKDPEVEDTVRFIQKKVPRICWQSKKITQVLKGRNLDETCRNIWYFVYEHIYYRPDEKKIEQVRSPRRTWWDRKKGVDCDCYTVFISSILTNLGIPHKYRITKYPKTPPKVPGWQHIYVVVPKDGNTDKELNDKRDYITLDCVKDEYDSEERYLEKKDFKTMRLDYLDGLDSVEEEYIIPNNQDAHDLAAFYDEEELGKVGNWLKKAVKTVAKPITQPLKVTANLIKNPGKVIKNIPKDLKKGAAQVKQGIHVINKVTNPGAILLRNGFLVAMKVNLFNIAKRLRYGYLTDEKAVSLGINLDKLKEVRKVREKAENIYYTAGGEKKNLAKAIIKGKGNRDGKVTLSGFNDDEYADQEEYEILQDHYLMGLGQLGEPATAASIAAATSVLTALAAALKQIKGLFNPGSKEEETFQSEEDAGTMAEVQKDYSTASEEEIANEELPQEVQAQPTINNNTYSAPETYVTPPVVASSASNSANTYTPPVPAQIPYSSSPNNYPVMAQADEQINIPVPRDTGIETQPSKSEQSQNNLPAKVDPTDESWMQKNSKLMMGVGAGILVVGGLLAWKLMGKEEKTKGNPKAGSVSGTGSTPKKNYKKKNVTVVKFYK